MPLYNIQAKRETMYDIEIWAEDEEEAKRIVEQEDWQEGEQTEDFSVDWYPLEVTEIEELEEDE
jgi:hypothetical protein